MNHCAPGVLTACGGSTVREPIGNVHFATTEAATSWNGMPIVVVIYYQASSVWITRFLKLMMIKVSFINVFLCFFYFFHVLRLHGWRCAKWRAGSWGGVRRFGASECLVSTAVMVMVLQSLIFIS